MNRITYLISALVCFIFLCSVNTYAQYFVYKYDPKASTVTDFVFDISDKVVYPSGANSTNSMFSLGNTMLGNGNLTQKSPKYLISFMPKTVGGRIDSTLNNLVFYTECAVTDQNGTTVMNKLYFAIVNTSHGMGMEILDPTRCYTPIDQVEFFPNTKFTVNPPQNIHGLTTPLVGDLNGDGKPEVVTTRMPGASYTYTNGIYVFSGQTGTILSTIAFNQFAMQDDYLYSGPTGWHPSAGRMALVDADRNGKGEIIIAWGYDKANIRHKKIVCYEVDNPKTFTFTEKWISDIPYDAYGAGFISNYDGNYGMQRPLVQVADLDEDGVPEIMVYNKIYNSLTGKLIAITEDMEPKENYLKNLPSEYESFAYLGRERVSGQGKLSNGTSIGGGAQSGDIAHAFPYIYDLDADGKMEIIAGGKIYYDINFSRGITNAFKVKSLYAYGLDVGDGYTAVADVNADGKAEVVVIMNDYNLPYNLWPQRNLRIIVYDPGFLKKSGDKWIPSQETPVILAEAKTTASRLGADQGTHSYVFIADIDGKVQNNKKFPEISILGGTYFANSAIPAHPNVKSIPTASGGFPATYVPHGEADGVLMSWTWDENASGVNDRLKLSFLMEHKDNSINTGFSLFDFDNDGIQDICYRDEYDLRILSPTIPFASFANIASTTPNYNIKKFTTPLGTITGYEYPVIADTDGDGSADMVVTGRAGGVTFPSNLNVIQADPTKTKFSSAPKVWNQYMYHPLKINEDLTTPLVNSHPLDPAFSYITDTANLDLYTQVYNNTLSQVVKYSIFEEEIDNGISVQTYPIYKAVQPGPNAKVLKAFIGTDSKIKITLTNIGDATLNSLAPIVVYDGNPSDGNIRGTMILPQDLFVRDTIDISSTFTVPLNIIMTIRVADASKKVGGVFTDQFTQIYKDCDWRNNVSRVSTDLILFNDTIISPRTGKIVIYPFDNDILPSDKCDSSDVKIISGIFEGQMVSGPSLGNAQIHTTVNGTVLFNDSIVYNIPPSLITQRDSMIYEVTCWETDRSIIRKDTAIIIIIVHANISAEDDLVTLPESSDIMIAILANDNIPLTCGTLSIGIKPDDEPARGTALIVGDKIKYTSTNNAGSDVFKYYLTCSNKPTDTAYAKVYVNVLRYPELVLLDSCSTNPKLVLSLQYENITYDWEYSADGITWTKMKEGVTDVMIAANKEGYYRLAMYINTTKYQISTGIKLTVEKIALNHSVWYNVSSSKIANAW